MTKRILALIMATILTATLFAGCKNNADNSSSTEWEIEYEYVDGDAEDASSADDTESDGESSKDNKDNNKNKNNTTNKDKDKNNTTNKDKDKNNTNKDDGKVTIPVNSNTNKTGFPIVKKKEKLSVLCVTRADLGDIPNSEFSKEYEKMTNIEIEWQLAAENQMKGKRLLALQSGNMPDIFTGTFTDEQMLQYSKEGAFVEYTKDILKEWAPNIYNIYNKYPEAWKNATTANGKMYSLPGLTVDFPYAQHFWWVRKTWLDKLGLQKPKTMDEFYEMLVAFKTKDPNGNGQADEIPLATWHQDGLIYAPWGFNTRIDVDTKGIVHNMYTTQNMKNGVTYWAKVYKEGLVDKTSMKDGAANNAVFLSTIASGKVGCFWWGWPSQSMDDALLNEYEYLGYPTAGNNGDFPAQAITVNPVVDNGALTISSKCKNVSAALRWLDYLFTNDGYMLKQYGAVGNAYKKTSETTYEFTGKEAGKNPAWAIKALNFLEGAKITNKEVSPLYERRYAMDAWSAETLKNNKQKFLPKTWKTQEEINNEKVYITYWNSVQYSYRNFVKGTKNMGSDWTALINEMNKKGINKYVAVLQKYYDRCNK